MAPEYMLDGIVSVKKDVYGFGAILLQTLSGILCGSKRLLGPYFFEWVSICIFFTATY